MWGAKETESDAHQVLWARLVDEASTVVAVTGLRRVTFLSRPRGQALLLFGRSGLRFVPSGSGALFAGTRRVEAS